MSQETPMTLEERIRRLEDIEAIRWLRNRYHASVNESRFGDCRALFTDDAVVELGYLARYEGIEAIDRGFREMGGRDRFFINNSSRAMMSRSTAKRRPAGPIWRPATAVTVSVILSRADMTMFMYSSMVRGNSAP
jgi:hypothetical protein